MPRHRRDQPAGGAATTAAAGRAKNEDDDKEPPFTPAIWLLVWTSGAAGFVEALGVMGSYSFMAMPALQAFFFPTQHSGRPVPTATPRLNTSLFSASSSGAAAADDPTRDAALRKLFCSLPVPQTLSLVPQLLPVVSPALAAAVASAHGRRAAIAVGVAGCVAAQLLQASAFHYPQLMVGVGLAYGGSAVLHTAVLLEDTELAPARRRGLFVCVNTIGQAAGWLCASLLAMGVSGMAPDSMRAVRGLYGASAVPGVILLGVLVFVSETPHSLVLRGHVERGREALRTIRGPWVDVGGELREICAAAAAPGGGGGPPPSLAAQARALFDRAHRAPLLLATALLVMQELAGRQVLERFVDALSSGIKSSSGWGMGRFALLATAQVAGAVGAGATVDRLGRRPVIAACAAALAAAFLAMGCLLMAWVERPGAPLSPSGGFALTGAQVAVLYALACLVEGAGSAGWISAYAAVSAELHPLRTRAVAVAATVSMTWVLAYVRFAVRGFVSCGLRSWTLVFYAGCNLACGALTLLILPEMAGTPLERAQEAYVKHWLWRRLSPPPLPGAGAGGPGVGGGGGGSGGVLCDVVSASSSNGNATITTAATATTSGAVSGSVVSPAASLSLSAAPPGSPLAPGAARDGAAAAAGAATPALGRWLRRMRRALTRRGGGGRGGRTGQGGGGGGLSGAASGGAVAISMADERR